MVMFFLIKMKAANQVLRVKVVPDVMPLAQDNGDQGQPSAISRVHLLIKILHLLHSWLLRAFEP